MMASSTVGWSPRASRILRALSAAMLGGLLVWSFMAPADSVSVFLGSTQAQNLCWLFLGVCVALGVVASRQGLAFRAWDWAGIFGCLLWLGFVSFHAGVENNPRTAWFGFWQCISLACCYYSTSYLLVGLRSRVALASLIVMGCCALSVQGVYQLAVEFPEKRAAYKANPDEFLQGSVADFTAGSVMRKRLEDRLYSPEPFAAFALANSLAVILSGGLILTLGLTLTARRELHVGFLRARCVAICGALALCLGVMLVTWFLTRSRSAYLALLVVLGLWLVIELLQGRGQARGLSMKAIAIGMSALFLFMALGVIWLQRNDRFVLTEAWKSLAFRWEYWQATVMMIAEQKLGVGLGNFQSYYPRTMLRTASETIADPHNWFLDIAATLSLPMACVVAAWLAMKFWKALVSLPLNGHDGADALQDMKVDDDPRTAKSLWIGGAVGGVLCLVALPFLVGIDSLGIAMGWLFALPLTLLMLPLVRALLRERLFVCGLAAFVMLLCLTASGSWQAPGIAIPLLVLLASSSVSERCELRSRSQVSSLRIVALPAVGLVCFIFQSWIPTTSSWALMQQSANARSLDERMEKLQAAMAADPLDASPQQFVAQLATEYAIGSPAELFSVRSDEALNRIRDWLGRDAAKSLNWQFAGDRVLELAARAEQIGAANELLLEKSSEFYSQAVERQPTGVQLRVQWSAVLALLGDVAEAKRQLQFAEQLSQQTPHVDRQLAYQQIYLPPFRALPAVSPQTSQMVQAEPIAAWIRSL